MYVMTVIILFNKKLECMIVFHCLGTILYVKRV